MKETKETSGVMIGHGTGITKSICQSLAQKGISTVVIQKETAQAEPIEAASEHWSGKPGQDLFFNGWKLLF